MHEWIGQIEWAFLKDSFEEVDPREIGVPEAEVRSFEAMGAICAIRKGQQINPESLKAQTLLEELKAKKEDLDRQRKEVLKKMKHLQTIIGGKHDLEVRRP